MQETTMAAGRPVYPQDKGDAKHSSRGHIDVLQPFVRVGVTGHLDLVNPDQARNAAAAALRRVLTILETARWPVGILRSFAPNATTLGYRIVSPLAEGADRVVADLALDPGDGLSGRPGELVVPLPFQLESYRGPDGQPGTDCSSPQSQAQFDRFARRALWVRPLRAQAPGGQAERDAWYREVGEYVVRHCDVLFALWDGRDNEQVGGTSAIVRFALEHGIPVVWIPVTRKDKPAPTVPGTASSWLLDDSAGRKVDLSATVRAPLDLSLSRAQAALIGRGQARRPAQELLLERLARLEELGRYARASEQARKDVATEERAATAAGPAGETLVASITDWIVPAYAISDGLARRYQLRLRGLNIGVYAAAAAAVALGAFAAIIFPYGGYWRLLVIFEAALLVGLLLVQSLDLRKKCRDRWVGFRALGEYLRIGRYLAFVTPKTASGLEFDRFARLYSWSSEPASTPWFAPVLEHAWDHRPDPEPNSRDVPWLRDYLITDWIDNQIKYHERRRDDHLLWDRIFRSVIQITLLATVLAVILHVFRDYIPDFLGAPHGRDLTLLTLAFLSITLTSIAAAFNGYAGQQRHSFHYARFRRMAEELRGIRDSLGAVKDMEQLRMHIAEVRRVTLGETTNWFEGMQEQLIESPT
jgi:hypothetical protein